MIGKIIRRITLKKLWLKHSYTFNWSHKPLCNRFKKGVIKINNVYICRSCTAAYSGLFLSLIILKLISGIRVEFISIFYIILFSLTVSFSSPPLYKKLPRIICDFLRFFMGTLITLSGYLIWKKDFLTGVTGIALLFIFWVFYFTQRKKRKSRVCNNCNEYGKDRVCTGFNKQAQYIRSYEEEATDYLLKTGYIPSFKNIK